MIFADGSVKEQVVGSVPESDISSLLDKLI
jgi:hypothetical protein